VAGGGGGGGGVAKGAWMEYLSGMEVRCGGDGAVGVVMRSVGNDEYSVQMDAGGTQIFPVSDLQPMSPNKDDQVIVASGESRRMTGVVSGISDGNCIVELAGDTGDMSILDMHLLCRYRQV
jgi:hypothetical protein